MLAPLQRARSSRVVSTSAQRLNPSTGCARVQAATAGRRTASNTPARTAMPSLQDITARDMQAAEAFNICVRANGAGVGLTIADACGHTAGAERSRVGCIVLRHVRNHDVAAGDETDRHKNACDCKKFDVTMHGSSRTLLFP